MQLFIFGNNDLASLAKWYFLKDSSYRPAAFVVDKDYIREDQMEGLPVIPYEEIDKHCPPSKYRAFCPVADNRLRAKKYAELKARKYKIATYVSTRATVLSPVGENCFVLEDNTIQPYVTIGKSVILWSGNHIGHHSIIKDNVFFASHVVLSGHCVVEPFAWFGVNSTIRDNLHIAEGTFVGMGSVVTRNTEPWNQYVGAPAASIGVINDLQINH